MSTLGKWTAVVVLGGGLAAGVALWRPRQAPSQEVASPDSTVAPEADYPTLSNTGGLRRRPAAPPDRPAAAAPATPGGGVKPIVLEPLSPERATAYRPAKLLHLSDGVPERDRGTDDRSPLFQRIVRALRPDGVQQQKILELWRDHEDARRRALAEQGPPSVGLPQVAPDKAQVIDRAFQAALAGVLSTDQRNRLALEMFPGGVDPSVPE